MNSTVQRKKKKYIDSNGAASHHHIYLIPKSTKAATRNSGGVSKCLNAKEKNLTAQKLHSLKIPRTVTKAQLFHIEPKGKFPHLSGISTSLSRTTPLSTGNALGLAAGVNHAASPSSSPMTTLLSGFFLFT
jgi:hypothetical protein